MKKLFLLIAVMFCVTSWSNAQEKGDMAAGVNLNMGFAYKDYSGGNFGMGAKYQYSITDHIRLEPAFTYYFKKDYISMWDLMANAHYLFKVADEKLNLYPIVGVGAFGAKASVFGYSSSDTNFAVNLGAGAEYRVSQNISVSAELKYMIVSDFGHLGLQIGAAYLF